MNKAMIIRLAIMLLGIANGALAMYGKSPLPFDDAFLADTISAVWVILASSWAAWKNNSFTAAAKAADKVLTEFKAAAEEELSDGGDDE